MSSTGNSEKHSYCSVKSGVAIHQDVIWDVVGYWVQRRDGVNRPIKSSSAGKDSFFDVSGYDGVEGIAFGEHGLDSDRSEFVLVFHELEFHLNHSRNIMTVIVVAIVYCVRLG